MARLLFQNLPICNNENVSNSIPITFAKVGSKLPNLVKLDMTRNESNLVLLRADSCNFLYPNG